MAPQVKEERRSAARRAIDRELREMSNKAMELAKEAHKGWLEHIGECTERFNALNVKTTSVEQKVDKLAPMASWFEARERAAQSRAEMWSRLSEFVIGMLKEGVKETFGKLIWVGILIFLGLKTLGN